MNSLKINGQEFKDVQIVKLQKGRTDEAIAKLNTAMQGADDVVFKVGEDVFVASGRDLFKDMASHGKVQMGGEGVTVEVDGKQAEVLAWDDQANNGAECVKYVGMSGFFLPVLSLLAGDMIGKIRVGVSLLAGVGAWAAATGAAYLYGTSRKMNLVELASMGTVVQKNSQPAGGIGHAVKKLFGAAGT